jgi:eukaryotic-like serine/threonine-protein kinase
MMPVSSPSQLRDARVGTVLAGRYRLDALLDQGSMGRVYAGEHVLMRKRVAVKVLHSELTSVPEFVARFEREAMAAANIGNEHVVGATDFGKLDDGSVFLVLEFVEGKNLRDEIAEGPIPLVRALHIARQIAYALESAHALGIVHRDLKPENIMLIEKSGDLDFVKVLDFGIAKVPLDREEARGPSSKPITKTGMIFGTPEYMPPEQALGQNVDERADLYSLGVILYEMLAGVRPFDPLPQVGVLGQQLSTPAPPLRSRAPGVTVPGVVERFVLKLLERDAGNRYQSAKVILDVIDQQLGYGPGRSRIPTLRHGTPTTDTDPGIGQRNSPSEDPFQRGTPLEGIPIPGLSRSLHRVTDWVDRRRSSLPASLRSVPGPVLLSLPLAVIGILAGFAIVVATSSGVDSKGNDGKTSASVRAAQAPASNLAAAPPDELGAATSAGPEALEALAKKYPNDAKVRVALGGAELARKEPERAIDALKDALALDSELRNDAQIASALWMLVQNKKSSSAALDLLKGPMGDKGVAILRDLVTTPGVRDQVKKDAQAALRELHVGPR